jgi:hypothetical protein
MTELLKTSQQLRAQGYSVIPVNNIKQPLVAFKRNGYTKTIPGQEIDSIIEKAQGIAIITGEVSGNLLCIDIDTKYDLSGDLATRIKEKLKETCPAMLKKSVIQKTVSGGYHFVVRVEQDKPVEGNKKLAMRDCTEQEIAELRKNNPKMKTSVRVLIETRGEGGYFLVAPSQGYEIIKGSFSSIGVLTREEYNAAFATFRSFSETFTDSPVYEPNKKEISQYSSSNEVSPWDDYNNKTDGVLLLESYGWVNKGSIGSNTIKLLRPGKAINSREHSAYYHLDTNRLVVFSTSTVFETDLGGKTPSYSPFGIYTCLEHNGDVQASIEDLKEKGFGSGKKKLGSINDSYSSKSKAKIEDSSNDNQEDKKTKKLPPSKPDSKMSDPDNDNDDISEYIGDFNNSVGYLNMVRDGTLPEGLKFGHSKLDNHLRIKKAQFNIVHGLANVGKSTMMWFIAALSAVAHGWRWIIYTGENDYEFVIRRLMETYVGKQMSNFTDEDMTSGEAFIRNHFTFITNDHTYSFKDILKISEILSAESHYNAIMIDPYNSLIVDEDIAKKVRSIGGNKHDYDYLATTEMRVFVRNTGMAIYLNVHTGTDGARRAGRDPENPPKMYEVEGGNKFASRADDYITIHRNTKDPDTWMYTDIHVDKIKVQETGGRPTPSEEPIKFLYSPSLSRFFLKGDSGIFNYDIFELHKSGSAVPKNSKVNNYNSATNSVLSNSSYFGNNVGDSNLSDDAPF